MTMKSVLLGAAAGIAAIGAAQAADLPMTKGEAVEYVKVCSAFGEGFFYIPGTDTCLKIGGEIRAKYYAFGGTGYNRNDNRSAFDTQARVWFDARTETDWGLLRSYFQINADSHPISNLGRGGVYNSNTFTVDKAFIQFGGLTAGYAHSFFGFYDNDYGNTIWAPYYAQSSTVNLLAYTAQFGGGFSATLSIEDGRDHRVDGVSIPVNNTSIALPFQGGQQVPDVVAQLRLDQSWGSVALQGAVHQLRTAEGLTIANPGNPAQTASIGLAHENKWGYAVGATALFKIPVIDGGHFIVEGQYADGATHYLGVGNSLGSIIGQSDLYPSRLGPPSPGNVIDITSFGRVKGWSIVAELGGNITPVLNANIVGSYIETKADGILANVLAGGVDIKVKEYTVAGNLTYTIVKGLSVAGEVAYTHQTQDFSTAFGGADGKENVWSGGVRLKRTF